MDVDCAEPLFCDILFPSGDELAYGQIVQFQTPACRASGVCIGERHQSIKGALRQDRGVLADTMCVIAKSLVEDRVLPDGSVDQNGVFRFLHGEHVRLNRFAKFAGRIRDCSQDRLAANNNNFIGIRVRGRRPNDMLEPGPFHTKASLVDNAMVHFREV